MDVLGLKNSVEGMGELAVVVTNQTNEVRVHFLQKADLVSGLLRYPMSIRLLRDSVQMDAPGPQLDHKENVEGFEGGRFDCEKIDR